MSRIQQSHLHWIRKGIAGIFYAALIIFLYFYIQSIDFNSLASVQVVWHFVIIATLFGMAMRYWQTLSWLVILKDLGAQGLKNSSAQLAFVYAKSWLGRYIPGTAPWILGKIYFASRHGVSKSKLAVSSLFEAILQIATVLALSSLLLMLDERFGVVEANLRWLMATVLGVSLLVILPPIFNRLVSFIYKIVRKKTLATENQMRAKTLYKGVALYTIGGIINGLFMFFLAKALYPSLGYENALFIIGATNLAGAIGIMAIFTPSGLGVREGIQLALLSLVMPPEFALVATIVARLLDVVMDLLFFVIAWLVKLVRPTPAA